MSIFWINPYHIPPTQIRNLVYHETLDGFASVFLEVAYDWSQAKGFRFIFFSGLSTAQQPQPWKPGVFSIERIREVGYFMLAVFGFSWPRRHGWHGRFPGMAWPRWVVKNHALVNQGDGFTPGLWRPLKPMGAQMLTIVIQSFFARSMVSAEAAKGVLLRKCSRALTGWGWVRGLY